MSRPIILTIRDCSNGINLFETNNFTGPIPRSGEWIRINKYQTYRVVSVTYNYDSFGIESVVIEV